MARTVRDFEEVISKNTATIKIADSELKYLRDRRRVLSNAKLTPSVEKQLTDLNKKIDKLDSEKVKAKIAIDEAKRIIPNLKKVEDIDKQLEREYLNYDRAARTGGKTNKSRINKLLQDREGLKRILMGFMPEAPKAPKTLSEPEGPEAPPAVKPAATKATGPTGPATPATGAGGKGPKPTGPGGKGPKPTGPAKQTGPTGPTPTTATGPVPTTATVAGKSLESLLAKTEFWYDLPDYIFRLDPKLGELLVEAVENNFKPEEFLRRAKLTPWWQKNAEAVRQRIVARAKYNELRAAGEDVSKTEYALDTATIRRDVQSRARQMGATLDPVTIDQIVGKIYDGFLEGDELAISGFIAPYIGQISSIVGTGLPGAGTISTGFSGQALQNYQTLQAIAKSNGLSLKDILPGISTATTGGDLETAVLQKLATGELDVNRIAQDARMIAGTGQPEFVRNLLNQGYDLEQIYSPYRSIMASELELNPEEIDLKELSGFGLFSDKGQSNIYDFKKALRRDSRWQYTQSARQEVSDSVLGVLRDFGFQG